MEVIGIKGLIIKKKWLQLILKGLKTMELRGNKTKIRGTIGLIESGSKKVFGFVDLVDVVEIKDEETYNKYKTDHCVDIKFNDIKYKHLYGWIFKNVRILKEPIPYNHKQGCVVWVNLDDKFKEMI